MPGEGGWELTSKLDHVRDFSADHTARKSLSWKITLSAGTGPGVRGCWGPGWIWDILKLQP